MVLGAKEEAIKIDFPVISNASCTTNDIAPFVALLEKEYGISMGHVLTIHAVTSDQSPQDTFRGDDPVRGWSGDKVQGLGKTGAAKLLNRLIPGLGPHDGKSIRNPVLTGSVAIYNGVLLRETSQEELEKLFKEFASKNQGIVGAEYGLDSRDIRRRTIRGSRLNIR